MIVERLYMSPEHGAPLVGGVRAVPAEVVVEGEAAPGVHLAAERAYLREPRLGADKRIYAQAKGRHGQDDEGYHQRQAELEPAGGELYVDGLFDRGLVVGERISLHGYKMAMTMNSSSTATQAARVTAKATTPLRQAL